MRRILTFALSSLIALAPLGVDANSLPIRGTSTASSGAGVLLSDAIRAYARYMNLPGVFIDTSVPRRHVNYVARNLDPKIAFDELLRTNGLTSIIDDHGALHVGSVVAIANQFGPTTERLIVRSGQPSNVISLLNVITHGRVSFTPDDNNHVVYAVGRSEDIAPARTYLAAESNPRETTIFTLRTGVNSSDVATTLTSLVADGSGSVVALPDRNSIMITGDEGYRKSVEGRIKLLDVAPNQVAFTISYIEITPTNDNTTRGITLGPIVAGRTAAGTSTSTSSASGTLVAGAIPVGQVSATLDALQSEGHARVLVRTTAVTASGKPATDDKTTQTPIIIYDPLTGVGTPRTVDSGVKLALTPIVGSDGISTTVDVSFAEITGYASNGYPIVAQRHTTNTVATTDHDTIIISGLYADEDLTTWTSNPPFSYIPIFGGLFHHRNGSRTHNEVVVVATPTILRNGETGTGFEYPAIPDDLIRHGIAPTGSNATIDPPTFYPTAAPRTPALARRSLVNSTEVRPAPRPTPPNTPATPTEPPPTPTPADEQAADQGTHP